MDASKFSGIMEKAFREFLTDEGYDNFLAGSRRFGYDTPFSDLDIIILAEGHKEGLLNQFLLSNGFMMEGNAYTKSMSTVWRLGKTIHVCVFTDAKEFIALREEHLAVEEALKNSPILKAFINEIRPYLRMSGAELYRSILRTFEGTEVEVITDEKTSKRKTVPIGVFVDASTT
jgi:hypothetical protein